MTSRLFPSFLPFPLLTWSWREYFVKHSNPVVAGYGVLSCLGTHVHIYIYIAVTVVRKRGRIWADGDAIAAAVQINDSLRAK